MRNHVTMEFPFYSDDLVYDGKYHKVKPLSMKRLSKDFYMLTYKYKRDGYTCILMRINDYWYNVPIYNYKRLFELISKRKLIDVDLEIFNRIPKIKLAEEIMPEDLYMLIHNKLDLEPDLLEYLLYKNALISLGLDEEEYEEIVLNKNIYIAYDPEMPESICDSIFVFRKNIDISDNRTFIFEKVKVTESFFKKLQDKIKLSQHHIEDELSFVTSIPILYLPEEYLDQKEKDNTDVYYTHLPRNQYQAKIPCKHIYRVHMVPNKVCKSSDLQQEDRIVIYGNEAEFNKNIRCAFKNGFNGNMSIKSGSKKIFTKSPYKVRRK